MCHIHTTYLAHAHMTQIKPYQFSLPQCATTYQYYPIGTYFRHNRVFDFAQHLRPCADTLFPGTHWTTGICIVLTFWAAAECEHRWPLGTCYWFSPRPHRCRLELKMMFPDSSFADRIAAWFVIYLDFPFALPATFPAVDSIEMKLNCYAVCKNIFTLASARAPINQSHASGSEVTFGAVRRRNERGAHGIERSHRMSTTPPPSRKIKLCRVKWINRAKRKQQLNYTKWTSSKGKSIIANEEIQFYTERRMVAEAAASAV